MMLSRSAPTRVEPGKLPSYRDPTTRPLRYLAQSVDAGDHSSTTIQRWKEETDDGLPQAAWMCWDWIIF
jgi:hypothetical protein